jgi:hypothetical protein
MDDGWHRTHPPTHTRARPDVRTSTAIGKDRSSRFNTSSDRLDDDAITSINACIHRYRIQSCYLFHRVNIGYQCITLPQHGERIQYYHHPKKKRRRINTFYHHKSKTFEEEEDVEESSSSE